MDIEEATETTKVLIVGAGPVGLFMSILLSRQNIPHILIEKRDAISDLPRARGVTTRSVEILTKIGLGPELKDIAMSEKWSSAFVYTETLAGDMLGYMPGVMAPGAAAALSPVTYVVAAQDRVDPMLYDAATSYPDLDIRFRHEAIALAQDDSGATVMIKDRDGTERAVRAEYVVAADGCRSPLRELAGIREDGRANLRSFINNFVRADLSRYTEGREGALIWTLKPGVEGVFQMLDEKEKWAIQVQYDKDNFDLVDWTDDYAKCHLHKMIGVENGEVNIEIIRAYGYTLSMMIAQQLVAGRLLLVGDAAHQVPPYGGFGLNTGLQTAHNLAWKLGAVLRGEAEPALLETFNSERREVAQRVCKFGATNAGFIEKMMTAVKNAAGPSERQAIVASSRQYGNWWGLDLGVHYEVEGAFVPDTIDPPAVDNPVIDFKPHAKPGYRAPHFWARLGNERVSPVIFAQERFTLLAGPDGGDWIDAVRGNDAPASPAITGYRVASDGDLIPEEDVFCDLYGIGPSGAVLIRPDGMIAFRANHLVENPVATLNSVLDVVLRRGVNQAEPAKDDRLLTSAMP